MDKTDAQELTKALKAVATALNEVLCNENTGSDLFSHHAAAVEDSAEVIAEAIRDLTAAVREARK